MRQLFPDDIPPRPRRPLQRRLAAVVTAAVFCALATGGAAAATLAVGSRLPALDLQDQHGQPVPIRPGLKRLAFAADKAAGDLAAAALTAQPPGVLDRQQAVYAADVSVMPGLVFRMFALPRLRELHFPVALVKDAALTADVPREPGRVTVLDLDNGVVTRVVYAADTPALQRALGIAAAP